MQNTRMILKVLYGRKEYWTQDEINRVIWGINKKQINMALWFLKKKGLIVVERFKIDTPPYRQSLYSINKNKEALVIVLIRRPDVRYVPRRLLYNKRW